MSVISEYMPKSKKSKTPKLLTFDDAVKGFSFKVGDIFQ